MKAIVIALLLVLVCTSAIAHTESVLYRGEVAVQNVSVKEINEALQKNHADQFFERATSLKEEHKFIEAIPLFLKALEIDLHIRPKAAFYGLLRLAYCHVALKQWQQAEAYYKKAISLAEKVYGHESYELAMCLNNLAALYKTTNRYADAERLFKRVLVTFEKTIGTVHQNYAISLNNLAELYKATSRYTEAERLHMQVLGIFEKTLGSEHEFYVDSLNNLASLHTAISRYAEAERLYKQVLIVREKTIGTEHKDFALALNNLAWLYETTNRYADAERLFKRVLVTFEKTIGTEHEDFALTLNNLGALYMNTGRYAEAERLLKRALVLFEKTIGTEHEVYASPLNNLAALYTITGHHAEVERLYKQVLAIFEKTIGEDHQNYSKSLNNLAVLYVNTGRSTEAERLFKQVLTVRNKTIGTEHEDFALTLNNLAQLYLAQQKHTEAASLFSRALFLVQKLGPPALLYKIQTGYSHLLEAQQNPEAAIFFGKQAVNTIQGMRQSVAGLGKETLKSFDDTIEPAYYQLSRLLIAQGRIPEAERVLELLKERQYFETLRRDAQTGDLTKSRIALTSLETAQDKLLEQAGAPLATLHTEHNTLRERKLRTPVEESRLKELETQLKTANIAYIRVLDSVVAKLSSTRADAREIKDTPLKGVLKELGKGTVGLYTLYYKDEYTLILVTPDYRRTYIVPVKDLPKKILAFRNTLKDPKLDPRPQAKELLDIILPPKAREELAQNGATTLMWHLDGPLRYLAIPALYDGSRYLVETYRNTTFTTSSYPTITKAQPRQSWQALGFGVSIDRTIRDRHFSCLPHVPAELSTVIRTDGKTGGIIPGKSFIDSQFTWDAMQGSLKHNNAPPLIHIATHFHLEPGNETMSYLVPGAGQEPITLDQLRIQDGLFEGVDLITLSACQTAIAGGRAEGREVDSLAMTAQQLGAKAVIATLWSVADDSTSLLMQQFYRLMTDKQLSKAEALRQAQLSLLQGTTGIPQHSTAIAECVKKDRSGNSQKTDKPEKTEAPEFTVDKSKPYAHPYYWAPFVLMGNWK